MEGWVVIVQAKVLGRNEIVELEVDRWQEVCLLYRLGMVSEPEIAYVRRFFNPDLYYEDDRVDLIGDGIWRQMHELAGLSYPPGFFEGLEYLPRDGSGQRLADGGDFGWSSTGLL